MTPRVLPGPRGISEQLPLEELALFVDFAPAAMAMFDRQMRYLVVNQRWRTDFSLGDQDLIGRSHYELFPDIPDRWKEVHRRCLAGATEHCADDRFETQDGSVYWLRWEVHPWRDRAGGIGGLLIFSENITPLKLLELALLESTAREQQRIGRDLHDGLGQELTGIAFLAAALAKSSEPEAARHLAELARHAIGTCRATAHGLAPLDYADGDLLRALQEMVELQSGAFGLPVRWQVTQAAPLRLAPLACEHLFRIAQEAVNNARHHAQASAIDVTLEVRATAVRLDVVDDGVGLAAPPLVTSGIGLKVMAARAGLIGACLSVDPMPRGGTRVRVECPQPP